jgi:hypothetical protein
MNCVRPWHLTFAAWLAGAGLFFAGGSIDGCKNPDLLDALEYVLLLPALLQAMAIAVAAQRRARNVSNSGNEIAAAIGMSLLATPALWFVDFLMDFRWCGGSFVL